MRPLLVVGLLAPLLLAITITISVGRPMSDPARWAWIGITLVLTAGLSAFLTRGVAARANEDRTLRQATRTLRDLTAGGGESLGERSVPELLDEMTERLCRVFNATWS